MQRASPGFAWDIIFPLFCWPWCGQELADRVGAACSHHATEKCPKALLLPKIPNSHISFLQFFSPFKRCYLREGIRGWTPHSAVSSQAGGGCETPKCTLSPVDHAAGCASPGTGGEVAPDVRAKSSNRAVPSWPERPFSHCSIRHRV